MVFLPSENGAVGLIGFSKGDIPYPHDQFHQINIRDFECDFVRTLPEPQNPRTLEP
jgi:hypothetical protein